MESALQNPALQNPALPSMAPMLPDPFRLTTVPRTVKPGEPRPLPTQEARHLIEAYQRLLEELLPAQEAIEADQERMAWGLLQAKQARPPDAFLDMQVFVFLDGLELRIRDFEEGCFKLSQVERRLERCLDDVESQLELEAVQQAGLVDEVLAARLVEQRRVIKLQQEELDQLHFEHQVLSEEASRLREEVAAIEPGSEDSEEEEDFEVGFGAREASEPPGAASPVRSPDRDQGRRASGRSHSGSARRPSARRELNFGAF